jgi:hypothetical protein
VSRAGEAPACQPIAGDFHGLPTVGLAGDAIWFEGLATAGPRIVRLGITGGPSLLAETPDVAWPTDHGSYRLHGGHRLWLAPESAGLQAASDDGGLTVDPRPDRISLVGAPDPGTGMVRSIEARPEPGLPLLHIRHEVRNTGARTVEAALWAITQLPPGGWVVLPQPRVAAGHGTRPNRLLALWPYTSAEDPRLVLRDGLVAVRGASGPDLKVGAIVPAGWVAWAHDGLALVRRWTPEAGAPHPDLGCDVEVFVTARYTELEVLGPMVALAPGGRAILTETWELRPVDDDDPARLREALEQPIPVPPALPVTAHQREA